MESLSETKWDVVIAGTGLAQSLLALSLSRSGKKILHLDRNQYYGGFEAALSLEEARKWQEQVNIDELAPFNDVEIIIPTDSPSVTSKVELGLSRSYTLSLSPQLLYAQSTLLPALVTSRVHEQLEFLAVGSWWICRDGSSTRPGVPETAHAGGGRKQRKVMLQKIPSGREDVFSDNTISARDKRSIMKFLRQVLQEHTGAEDFPSEFGANSLADVLSSQFNIPYALQHPLLALSLSQDTADSTNVQYAMSRIRRHLHSIGMFGPGFGAMTIKYGGGAEIAQVGCRAGAVGGGVYVLGRGIDTIEVLSVPGMVTDRDASGGNELSIKLSDDELITSRYVVGDGMDLPNIPTGQRPISSIIGAGRLARSMSVVSSPLEHLFPPTSENGPIPAGAVVVFGPEGSRNNDDSVERDIHSSKESPIYLVVHSSDSGECPNGQCVIYASTRDTSESGRRSLSDAVNRLLNTVNEDPPPRLLWSMVYIESGRAPSITTSAPLALDRSGQIISFPPKSLDLAFDDALVDSVKAVWRKIMGAEADDADFLRFEERENIGDDED